MGALMTNVPSLLMPGTRAPLLKRTPANWAGHYRQTYWEIPRVFHNATFLEPDRNNKWTQFSPLLPSDLREWVREAAAVASRRSTDESGFPKLLLVGNHADEFAAATALDFARQKNVYSSHWEKLLAWTDTGQVQTHRRDHQNDRDVREWMERAVLLVSRYPCVGRDEASYHRNFSALLEARSKKPMRSEIMYCDPYTYEEYPMDRFAEYVVIEVH